MPDFNNLSLQDHGVGGVADDPYGTHSSRPSFYGGCGYSREYYDHHDHHHNNHDRYQHHHQGGEAVQEDPAGAGRQARPPGQQCLRWGLLKNH